MHAFRPAVRERDSHEPILGSWFVAANEFSGTEHHERMPVWVPGGVTQHADESCHQLTVPVVTVFAFAGSRSLRVRTAMTLAITLAVPVSSRNTFR